MTAENTGTATIVYTQSDLATRYGVTRQYIVAEMERGRYLRPSSRTATGFPLWDALAVAEYEKASPKWAERETAMRHVRPDERVIA